MTTEVRPEEPVDGEAANGASLSRAIEHRIVPGLSVCLELPGKPLRAP